MQILCLNADALTTAKLQELRLRVRDTKPKIIAVSEVKPKNISRIRTEVMYYIEDYMKWSPWC